jgi:hypothetical protein
MFTSLQPTFADVCYCISGLQYFDLSFADEYQDVAKLRGVVVSTHASYQMILCSYLGTEAGHFDTGFVVGVCYYSLMLNA